MKLESVFDADFAKYGRVLTGLDCTQLLQALEQTEKPEDAVVYVPSCVEFEALPIFETLKNSVYGGMPIQIGYCNGSNTKLNCVEYHRDSEINIVAQDTVFLLALQTELQDGKLDTHWIRAFTAPAGSVVELFATTLHYAPCNGAKNAGFRVAVVLPRGTNTQKPDVSGREEDALLWAKNKWLIAHEQSTEAAQGAFVGLMGENPDIQPLL